MLEKCSLSRYHCSRRGSGTGVPLGVEDGGHQSEGGGLATITPSLSLSLNSLRWSQVL